jgi:hypothetical protein
MNRTWKEIILKLPTAPATAENTTTENNSRPNGRRFGARSFLGILVILFCSMGASCVPRLRPNLPTHPVVFESPPDLPRLLDHIHRNSSAVQRLSAEGVQLRIAGAPVALRSTIEFERPDRFKLTGDFMGTRELDVGSNEQLLWIWGRHAPGALLFVRHDQYDQTVAHQVMPVPPSWLIEALGVLSIDPLGQYSSPTVRPDGKLEIQSQWLARRGDPLTRSLVVDPRYGWVVEQHIQDQHGRLLASAYSSDFRHYPEWNLSLPDRVKVKLELPGQPQAFEMSLDIGGYTVNGFAPPDPHYWSMPDSQKLPVLDLADPRVQQQFQTMLSPARSPPVSAEGPVPVARDYRYQYRGYSRPDTYRR